MLCEFIICVKRHENEQQNVWWLAKYHANAFSFWFEYTSYMELLSIVNGKEFLQFRRTSASFWIANKPIGCLFLSSFKCWILNMRWIRNNQIPSKLNVYYPNRLHFCLFEIQKVTNQTIKYYILNGCIATSSKQYFLFDVDLREKCSKNLISQWSRDLNSNITQREICCVANWIRCQNSIEEFQLRHRRFYYEIVLQRNGWQKKTGAFMI